MTQIEEGRAGRITPEMECVAAGEGLSPEVVRDEVGRGRITVAHRGGDLF